MAMNTSTAVLLGFLDQHGVPYRTFTHEPCRSSSECAQVRSAHGAGDAMGAKALVLCSERDGAMRMFVLPGNRRLDNRAVRKSFGAFRLATIPELSEATAGLAPGEVPPLILPTMSRIGSLYVDESLLGHAQIGFNAASLTQSVVMSTTDYFGLVGCEAFVSGFTAV